jgi:signal transduction histidine kinase
MGTGRGTRESIAGPEAKTSSDAWRGLLLTRAGRVLFVLITPIGLDFLRTEQAVLRPLTIATLIVTLLVIALVAFAPNLSLRLRASLLVGCLLAFVVAGTHGYGPRPAMALAPLAAALIAALAFDARTAVAILILGSLLFFAAGSAGRSESTALNVEELSRIGLWGRMTLSLFGVSSAMALLVTSSIREVEESRTRLARAYDELGQVARRADATREDERRRISRELHDELGQALAAMKINLQLAANGIDVANGARRIADTVALTERTIQCVRELSRVLRPPLLDELGLAPALQAFLDEQGERSGLHCELQTSSSSSDVVPDEIKIAAFRIVQEAVTNVLRHAHARSVLVVLQDDAGRFRISVRDDGEGFDVAGVLERARGGGHLGLIGMRERVRGLGGTWTVHSAPGRGTAIDAELPFLGFSG